MQNETQHSHSRTVVRQRWNCVRTCSLITKQVRVAEQCLTPRTSTHTHKAHTHTQSTHTKHTHKAHTHTHTQSTKHKAQSTHTHLCLCVCMYVCVIVDWFFACVWWYSAAKGELAVGDLVSKLGDRRGILNGLKVDAHTHTHTHTHTKHTHTH